MPNWKKLIVSGSDANLNSLDIATELTASDALITNDLDVLGNVGIGTTSPSTNLEIVTSNPANGIKASTNTGVLWGSILNTNSNTFPVGKMTLKYGATETVSITALSNEMRLGSSQTQMSFYASSGEKMRIHSNGNVGIGTTSPAEKLVISSNASQNTLRLENTDTSIDTAQEPNALEFYTNDASVQGTGVTGKISQYAQNAGNLYGITFNTYNTSVGLNETMRIDAYGNVGIGTTSPTEKLQVTGNVSASGDFIGTNFTGSSFTGSFVGDGSGLTGVLVNSGSWDGIFSGSAQITGSLGVTGSVLVDGNVGIGTTNPGSKLDVYGIISLGGSQFAEYVSNDDLFIIGDIDNAGAELALYSDFGEAMRIDLDGNVGIGTNNPDRPLSVVGGNSMVARFQSTNTTSFIQFSNTVATADQVRVGSNGTNLILSTNYTERMRIDSSGNVGIGTTSPGQKLHVLGEGKIQGNLMIGASSDIAGASGQLHIKGPNAQQIVLEDTDNANLVVRISAEETVGFKIQDTTNSNTLFFGDEDGNVGIGTTSPTEKLQVTGNVSASGDFIGTNFTGSSFTGSFVGDGSGLTGLNSGSWDGIFSGSAQITGSLGVTGSLEVIGNITTTGNYSGSVNTNYFGDEFNAHGNDGNSGFTLLSLTSKPIIFAADSKLHIGGFVEPEIPTILTSNNVEFAGAITASSNISASGTVTGLSGSFSHLLGNSPITVQDSITFQSQITASSDISASGTVEASLLKIDNYFVANTVGSELRHGFDSALTSYRYGKNLDGSHLFLGDITASNNISATGNISASGDLYTNEKLFVGNKGAIGTDGNDLTLIANTAEWTGIQIGRFGTNTQNIELYGPVTASGNISAAGTITATTVDATTFLGDLNGTINTATTAVTKPDATNDTTVATTAFVQSLIGTIPAGLVFQGTWNAATNTPTLADGTGTTGHFYIVSTDGSTNLDGITDWKVGDWAVFVEQGATDAWEKVDNSSVLDGSGTGNQITKWAGSGTSNTLTDSIIVDNGTNIGIGVANPGEKLDVNGNLLTRGDIVSRDSYPSIYVDHSGTVMGGIRADATTKLELKTLTTAPLSFQVNSSQKMLITNSGNVGIGTNNPTEKLTVEGNISASGDFIGTNFTGSSFTGSFVGDGSGLTGITLPAPNTPSTITSTIVGETIEIAFNQSTTSNIDYYQVWSSDDGGDFGIIAQITPTDFSSTMTVVDTTFITGGTMSYRVYAVKSGVYSSPGTTSKTYTVGTLDVTDMTVINLNTAYYIQYEKPASRFIDHIEIYMDSQTTQAALSRSNASIVYSGQNPSFMKSVGVSNNFHQFWVEIVTT